MPFREKHVRRFAKKYPHLIDRIDEAIPLKCCGENASDTLKRLRDEG